MDAAVLQERHSRVPASPRRLRARVVHLERVGTGPGYPDCEVASGGSGDRPAFRGITRQVAHASNESGARMQWLGAWQRHRNAPSSGPHRAHITDEGVVQVNSLGACNAGLMLKLGFSPFPSWSPSRWARRIALSLSPPQTEDVLEPCSLAPASTNGWARNASYVSSLQGARAGEGDPKRAYHQPIALSAVPS